MAARRPFWKWCHWKSIGFCLWPPSTCIWNLKLKFQRKLDLCSGNHVVYRQTDGQTDGRTRWIQYTPPPTSLGGGITVYPPPPPPSNFIGRGYKDNLPVWDSWLLFNCRNYLHKSGCLFLEFPWCHSDIYLAWLIWLQTTAWREPQCTSEAEPFIISIYIDCWGGNPSRIYGYAPVIRYSCE